MFANGQAQEVGIHSDDHFVIKSKAAATEDGARERDNYFNIIRFYRDSYFFYVE